MKPILILTTDIDNEKETYKRLKKLGYEAFLTTKLVDYWENNHNFPELAYSFSIVLFSNTLTLKKIGKMISALRKHSDVTCLLKVENIPNAKQMAQLKKIGIVEVIHDKSLLSIQADILEKIEEKLFSEGSFVEIGDSNYVSYNELFSQQLDPTTKKLYQVLLEQKGIAISRNDLSIRLWGKCNNSTLSQMSSKIRKLNSEIQQYFGIKKAVETEWGVGYFFNKTFCRRYLNSN